MLKEKRDCKTLRQFKQDSLVKYHAHAKLKVRKLHDFQSLADALGPQHEHVRLLVPAKQRTMSSAYGIVLSYPAFLLGLHMGSTVSMRLPLRNM